MNGPEGWKLARKKSLAVSVACMEYTDLLQVLQGEHLISVFSSIGTLISASAAPHCGARSTDTVCMTVFRVALSLGTERGG